MSPPHDNFIHSLPIFHNFNAFLKALTAWQIQVPKPHRHTVGAKVVNKSYTIFELLFRANVARGYKRTAFLNEASLELDLLKHFLRLANDTGAMTDKHCVQLQGQVQEIGRLLGGWIKDQLEGTKRPPTEAEGVRGM